MARNLTSLTISAPTSDPTQSEGGNFTFTVTPGFAGGGGVNAYDLDLQWDQGTATWQTIPGSGGLSTSGTAYYASTTQDTAFTITVDCNTSGSYNIRAINTSRSITSTPTSQAVTVVGNATAEPTGAEISGDAGTSESTIGIDVDAPTAAITGEAQAPADVTGDASVDLTGAAIAGEAGTAAAVVPRPTVGPFAFGSHGLAVNSYGTFTHGAGAVSDQGEPTGAAIAGQAGAPANVTGDANYTLTGAAAAGEAGAPSSVTTGVSYTATGAEAPGEAGTVTPNTDVNYTVTGAAIAGEAGTSTVQIDISVDLTGAQIAGEAGTSASEVSIDADLTGAASAGEAQTVTVTGDANYTLTGAAIAGEAGTSDAVTPDAVAEPTGAESAAEAGTVTAQGDANYTLTGAEIGADAGTSSVTVDISVSLTGAESSADAGTVVGDGGSTKGTFDTPNVSPLGLAIRQYGTFDHVGLLRNGLGDLTPLGLHQRVYGSFEAKLQGAVITGAQSNAEAGTVNVVATTGRKSQLSPHGLVTYPRNFSKQVNQNVSVNITGAEIELQWSTPDLADASVYTDGSDIDGESGSVTSSVAFVTTAAIAGEAGTVSVSVDIDAAVTGAEITGETGGVTAIGGTGGVDVAVTPNPPVEITGEAGTVTAAYDWTQTITGAQINAEAALVGLDIKRDVSATVTGAQIDAESADPTRAGPHVSVNIYSGTINCEAGEPEQVMRKGGRVRRPRYVVEIDGQLIQASSPQEVQYLLEQARELATESAERDVVTSEVTRIPTVTVRTASGKESTSEPIRYAVQQTQKAIRQAYVDVAKRRAIDEEISKLLIAKIELEDQDEEDALLAILLS